MSGGGAGWKAQGFDSTSRTSTRVHAFEPLGAPPPAGPGERTKSSAEDDAHSARKNGQMSLNNHKMMHNTVYA